MKKLFLLPLSLFAISGCDYYSQYTQCNPENNYINLNIEAIEKYNRLVSKDLVRSYYMNVDNGNCLHESCFYKYKKVDFYEVHLNTKDKKGIYTVFVSSDNTKSNCYFKKNSPDTNCYIIEKNENNIIKSQYHFILFHKNDITYRKFIDKSNNIILIDSAYQTYSKPKIAGISSGAICPQKKTPSNYKINTLDYPSF